MGRDLGQTSTPHLEASNDAGGSGHAPQADASSGTLPGDASLSVSGQDNAAAGPKSSLPPMTGQTLQPNRPGPAKRLMTNRWRLIAIIAILLFLGVTAIVALIQRSAEEQDNEARRLAETQLGAALAATQRSIAATTLDYAWWDDAYQHLAQQYDAGWAATNLAGATVIGPDKLIQGALVFDPAGHLLYGLWLGQSVDIRWPDRISGGLQQLLQQARSQEPGKPHAVSGLLVIDGKASLVAAASLLPFSTETPPPPAEQRAVLVFAKVLDPANLRGIGETLGVSGLQLAGRQAVETAVGPAEIPLIALDGSRVDTIQWQPPRPGRTILIRLMPQIIAVVAIMALLAGIAVWLMLSSQRRNRGYLDLIEAKNRHIEDNLQLWRLTIEAIEYGISVFDKDGRLLLHNQAWQRIWDLPDRFLREGAPVAPTIDWALSEGGYSLLPDPTRPADLRPQDGIGGHRWTYRKDEQVIEVQRLPVAEIGGFISISRDLTQRLQHEEELVQAWEQAVLANRAKSEFLANISHELRTPLNAVIGFSEVLELEIFGPLANERYRAYISDIKASGTHLLSLINDILDLSKIEAGKFALKIDEVECSEMMNAVARLIRPRAEAGALHFTVHPLADPVAIGCDERAVKQVLINLLSNAIKFTPAGGRVELECRLAEDGVAFVVRDTGIGISAQDIETALAPFGQIDSHLSRRFEGTGLGLPIVKGICELHGGSLLLESVVGRGTTVTAVILDQLARPGYLQVGSDI
jgi:signal transduction histidine kinase/sensor domain CHASE-containing protein